MQEQVHRQVVQDDGYLCKVVEMFRPVHQENINFDENTKAANRKESAPKNDETTINRTQASAARS